MAPINTALAQCDGVWSGDFGQPRFDQASPRAFLRLPDGGLLIGGQFRSVSNSFGPVVRYRPASSSYFQVDDIGRQPQLRFDGVSAIVATSDGGALFFGHLTPTFSPRGEIVSRWDPNTNTVTRLMAPEALAITSLEEAVAVPDGSVIVSGRFSGFSDPNLNSIASYDPGTRRWSSLGAGLQVQSPTGGVAAVNALAVLSDGDIIAGGNFTASGATLVSRLARFDTQSQTWTPLGLGVDGVVNDLLWLPETNTLLVGGQFNSAGGLPIANLARLDLTTGAWSPALSTPVDRVTSIIRLLDQRVAVASNTGVNHSRAAKILVIDPATGLFNELPLPGVSEILRMTEGLPGDLILAGSITPIVPNDVKAIIMNIATGGWRLLSPGLVGPSNMDVFDLQGLQDGRVAVVIRNGGYGSLALFSPASQTMSIIPSFLSGPIRVANAVAQLPNGDLVLGGMFDSIDGVPASGIARYSVDQGQWRAIGGAANAAVYSLFLTRSGDLLAGGSFSTMGGVPALGIARYNPHAEQWSAIGTRGAAYFAVLELPNGDIIAGGFPDSTGVSIARFSQATQSWSPIGSGVSGALNEVWALALLPSGEVAVGGSFTTAGGLPARNLAAFEPSTATWRAFPPLNFGYGTIFDIDVLSNGDLTVVGELRAGRALAVLRASDNQWVVSGTITGAGDTVFAAHPLPDGRVMLGGDFDQAFGWNANALTIGRPGPRCLADFNCTSGVTLDDLYNFLDAWFRGQTTADVDASGQVGTQDIFVFLDAYFRGC